VNHPPRVGLFIDAGYLEKLCQDHFAGRADGARVPLAIDFKKLPSVLAKTKPVQIFYYYCMPFLSDPPLPAEQASFDAKARFCQVLQRFPRWTLREGVLERRGGFRSGDQWLMQKRIDVLLACDVTRLVWTRAIDLVVLLSGDSDFVPLVAECQAGGVPVTLRYHPGTAHADLIAAANEAIILTREELVAIALAPRGASR
jgi:uncharacterized LabA/DUF88 family protein